MTLPTGRARTPSAAGSAQLSARRSWASWRGPSVPLSTRTSKWRSPWQLELDYWSLRSRYNMCFTHSPCVISDSDAYFSFSTCFMKTDHCSFFSTGLVSKSTRALFQEQETIQRGPQVLHRPPPPELHPHHNSQVVFPLLGSVVPSCPQPAVPTRIPCSKSTRVHQALRHVPARTHVPCRRRPGSILLPARSPRSSSVLPNRRLYSLLPRRVPTQRARWLGSNWGLRGLPCGSSRVRAGGKPLRCSRASWTRWRRPDPAGPAELLQLWGRPVRPVLSRAGRLQCVGFGHFSCNDRLSIRLTDRTEICI